MRMLFHYACLIGFIVCIAGTYLLSDIANGAGSLMANSIGWLTSLQYLLASLFMLGAWLTAMSNQSHYRWLLLAGIIARLLLIPADTYTSNDTDRYLWDGIVAAEGYDPYQINANDPQVSHLRAIWPTPPEHAHYATLYPPLAIATFSLTAMAGPGNAPLIWKCLTTVAGLITLLLTVRILQHRQCMQHIALVALSPILVLETGVGGHLDIFSTLAVTAALLMWQQKNYLWLGVMIGIGALFKLLPIILLLPMTIYLGLTGASIRMLLASLTTLLIGYGISLLIGWQPIGVLPVFFEKWRFGSPLFSALESIFSGMSLNITIAALLVAGLGFSAFISRTKPIRGMQWALSTPLLLSPVVFPWYLSALVPLLALAPSGFLIAWLCVLPLTYEVLNGFIADGVWMPATWPLIMLVIAWVSSMLWHIASVQFNTQHHRLTLLPGSG